MLHVTNGESVSLDSTGLGGEILTWVDVLHEGPVPSGMGLDELHRLASQTDTVKLNLSNFAAQLAGGGPGSTTVAADRRVEAHCVSPR